MGGETRQVLAGAAGILAVFWAQWAWVRPTNFSGYDEWLEISLAAHGVVSFPHANRPFTLMWHALPGLLGPHSVTSYYVAHGTYLALTGCLLMLVLRWLVPGRPLFAFLAGVFCAVWAPQDAARLNSVALAAASGFAFGSLLAVATLVASWRRGNPVLLAVASALAFVMARGNEVAVPVLAVAPLLLLPHVSAPGEAGARSRKRWLAWAAVWSAGLLPAVVLTLRPLVQPSPDAFYQSALGLDPHPVRVLHRLLQQFGYHLLPLVSSPGAERAHVAVPLAVAVFGGAFVWMSRYPEGPAPNWPRLMMAGLVLAALGHAAFTLSPAFPTALRTQFVPAPGMGVLLAAAACFAGEAAPRRWGRVVTAALAAWVVGVGTARTVAMQREWDRWGVFALQNQALQGLTRVAPDLKDHTMVVLLDERKAFPATFTFRHAVSYLYGRRALGLVWGGSEFLYPCVFVEQGVRCDPWPQLQEAWKSPPTLHRYDETVIVRYAPSGEVDVLREWPGVLPPLPAGARYDPSARIVSSAGRPEHAILKAGAPR